MIVLPHPGVPTVSLTFELSLDERLPDRVVISVCLAPGDGSIQIEGVTVELLSPRQQSLGPRLLLPVSGQLVGPLVTKAELRAHAPLIPPGSVILGTAWTGDEQIEATCAADPWVGLEAHLRGYRVRPPSDRGGTLDDLGEEELGRVGVGQRFPVLVDALEGESLTGTVVWISSEAEFTPKNVQTRKARAQLVYAVKLRIENREGRLHIGMPAEVEMVGSS